MAESIRILCVDDEPAILSALRRVFLEDDYELLTAASGAEGLLLLEENRPVTVVLSDYRMPGMDGVEFLREVFLRFPDCSRIVLSGFADTAAVVSAINEGRVDRFLGKPWDEAELRQVVAEEIARVEKAVHDKRVVQETLKTQEALYRAAFEGSPVAMAHVQADGTILKTNSCFADLMGYRAEALEGRNLVGMTHPPDAERTVRMLREGATNAEAHLGTIETRYRAKGGREVRGRLSLSPLRDNEGRLLFFVVAVEDVTSRRRLEADLRRQLSLMAGILQARGTAIFVKELECRYLLANETMLSILGKSEAEILGKTDFDLLGRTEGRRRIEEDREIMSCGVPVTVEEVWECGGERRHFLVTKAPLRDERGTVSGLVGVASDVTERKKAEEALRASEERYRSYFELGVIGMAIISPAKEFREVNDRLCEILGYRREELLGTTWAELTHPDDLASDSVQLGKVFSGEVDGHSLEKRYLRKDGEVIHGAVSVKCVRRQDGAVEYFVALLQDITARRLLEEQLRQSQKMEAVGQLAGGIAHDFSNLITAIAGYSELILSELPDGSPLRNDALEIQKAGDRAALLTRQLLAFSRRQVLEPRIINLNDIVLGVEEMLRRLIGETIEVRTALDPALGRVNVDAGQIEQVLVNLCVNARDAMPGGGLLLIRSRNVEPAEENDGTPEGGIRPTGDVLLEISDSGCGMDAEMQRHIFEPFFTTKAAGRGTGLGLATVDGIVRQSGGRIAVESEKGRGATFRIYFPRIDDPVAEGAAELAAGAVQGGF